jgi:hypothetical protein
MCDKKDNKEEKKMGIAKQSLNTADLLRKEEIRKASKRINSKYKKAFELISKN